jgi:anti-anti-sigma factor
MESSQGQGGPVAPGAESAGGAGELRAAGFSGVTGPSGVDDGLITVRGMESVALAFVSIPSLREHQAGMLQERLMGVAERARGRLAVSMADVGDMTSAGINALVAVNARCRELGGHLSLFGVGRELRKLLKVTKLERAIVVVETAHEAVRSFGSPPRRGFFRLALSWARQEKDAA